MKSTHKVFYLLFFSYVIAFITLLSLIVILVAGKSEDLNKMLTIGIVLAFLLAFFKYVFLKPRYAYLNSDENDEPPFSDKQETIITIDNKFIDFMKIKQEVEKEWIVTHFDKKNEVIKFRSKLSFL